MTPTEKKISELDGALTPVKWITWVVGALAGDRLGAKAALQAKLRRGAALLLCLGMWTVAVFLVYDSADRWLGSAKTGRVITGILAFPFSLLAAAGALVLTVHVGRWWKFMGKEISANSEIVDRGQDSSYLNHPPKNPESEGR